MTRNNEFCPCLLLGELLCPIKPFHQEKLHFIFLKPYNHGEWGWNKRVAEAVSSCLNAQLCGDPILGFPTKETGPLPLCPGDKEEDFLRHPVTGVVGASLLPDAVKIQEISSSGNQYTVNYLSVQVSPPWPVHSDWRIPSLLLPSSECHF